MIGLIFLQDLIENMMSELVFCGHNHYGTPRPEHVRLDRINRPNFDHCVLSLSSQPDPLSSSSNHLWTVVTESMASNRQMWNHEAIAGYILVFCPLPLLSNKRQNLSLLLLEFWVVALDANAHRD